MFDFDDDVIWKWKICRDKEVLVINEETMKRVYVRTHQQRYEEVEWSDEYEKGSFVGILGYLYSDGTLKI